MIWIISMITLSLICILQFLFIYNLYRQTGQLEAFIENTNERENKIIHEAENYYIAMLKLFTEAKHTMDSVDKRGAFSSDDEVGFTFKIIKIAIDNVANQLENLKKSESGEN